MKRGIPGHRGTRAIRKRRSTDRRGTEKRRAFLFEVDEVVFKLGPVKIRKVKAP